MATKYCPDCETEKSVNDFSPEDNRYDGLRTYCKTCNSKRAREYRERKRSQEPPTVFENKECPGCHIVKPAKEFYYILTDACGVYEFCRSCCPSPSGGIGKFGHKKKITIQDDILLVELTQGQTMTCDNIPEAWLLLQQHNWCACNFSDHIYAMSHYDDRSIYFHVLIMNCPNDRMCDHLYRDTLDNRRSKLRIADITINNRNTKIRSDNTSGIKGVSLMGNIWRARATNNEGKRISRNFSIDKYGATEAWEMAVQQRLTWEKEFGYMPS